MRILEALLGQRFVVHGAGGFRVERKLELAVPVEAVAGAGQLVVAIAYARPLARHIRGVGGDFIGDDAGLDVLPVGQAQVFLGRHVAQHGGSVPADHGGADGRRDVVVAGRDIGDQRAQRVKRRFVAELVFLLHLQLDLVHRDVARPLDHHLHVELPGLLGQLAQRLQLRELRLVARIGHAAWTQPVAERKAHVVFLKNPANVIEALVKEILLVVLDHPLGQDGAAAADDAGNAPRSERNVLHQHAGVDGHVVHALLGLFLDYIQHHARAQVFHAAHARQRFVNRHGADRHRRSADDGLANGGNVAAGREVHHRVGSVFHRIAQLFQFAFHVRNHRRVADIGVDLALGGNPDRHRLQVGVVDVGGNNQAPARHLGAHQLGRQAFALRDKVHLFGDDPLPGIIQLRAYLVVFTFFYPVTAHRRLPSSSRARLEHLSSGGQRRPRFAGGSTPRRIISSSSAS